ncbi:MAG TPA: condensation domain-containing protein, partial [Archangium sp.]|nr:condensation domain-containing protein [Archangium sp.]
PDAPHYPMSDAQRRLWLVDQSRGDSRIYNTPLAFVLEGRLDEQALEQSLRELVARHESLRTTLVLVGGEPRQRVGTGEDFRLERRDCSSAADPLAAARELAREDAHRPFELARGPLFRAHLIRCGPERYLLALNLHHVICDSWSLAVLTKELRALYAARVSGLPSPLAPLPVQYRDFSAWRQQLLAGPSLDAHRAYWLQKLDRPAEPLALPIDHPRSSPPSGRGAIHSFDLGPAEHEALGRLAESTSSSLFVVLVSLVKVLLHRYTHQRDISIGSAVAGRSAVELEEQIGLFVNTVVFRDVLDPQASLRTLVEGVRQTAVDAYAYQDYPYDALVEQLGGPRHPDRHPLFDVWVLLQEEQPMVQELGSGVLMRQEEWSFGISLFDLSFQFEKRDGGLRGRLQYDSALYEPATIELMVERLRTLVNSATQRPDETLERLDFLVAAERAQAPVRPFDGFRFG